MANSKRKSSRLLKIRNRRTRQKIGSKIGFERLEDRKLLAADFLITEFSASNDEVLLDDNGNSSDWIEIHNAGNSAGNLQGFALTDDPAVNDKFVFPSVSVGAGQYLVVFAGDDTAPLTGNDLYTGFGLGASGEYVGLIDLGGTVVSEFGIGGQDFPVQYEDISYGVEFSAGSPTTSVSYFATPSPGSANIDPIAGITERVFANQTPGFYETAFQVALTTATPGATIRYTTDGSTPTNSNGDDYTVPLTVSSTTNLRAIAVKTDYLSAVDRTWSYLFLDDILTQSLNGDPPPGWPSEWGQKTFVDYGLDPDVFAIEGSQAIRDSLLSIPTWSITTDLDNLFDPDTGIYANAQERGRDWERPASVELINPDGEEGFQVNAGLRIKGAYSRRPENPKNSLKLYFRDEYGDAELNYPVHGSEGVDTFKRLDLRTAQNWSWSFNGVARANFIEDQLARYNQRDLGQPYTRSVWFHMYLNGQYWGLYQTQERHDGEYGPNYFGGEKEDYDVIKVESGRASAAEGNIDAYNRLFDQANALGPDGRTPAFADNAAYLKAQGLNADGSRNENYEVLLDVDNLITYMMLILSGGNRDAPIGDYSNNLFLNNFYTLRNRNSDQGFIFLAHDSEHTHLSTTIDRNGPFNDLRFDTAEYFNPQTLHQRLMANAEYRLRFADNVQTAFFNGGVLSVEGQQQRITELAALIDPAIIAESARWGDAKRGTGTPRLRSTWINAIDDLRNNYFPARNPIVLEQFRNTTIQAKDNNGNYTVESAAPLLPDVDAPYFLINNATQHGGQITPGSALGFDAAEGTIYYTLDGTDPRLFGGDINQDATPYSPSSIVSTAITEGDLWKYHDQGLNLGTAWRNGNYNDSTWAAGDAELGYGENDEATVVSYGSNANFKHVTTYFRNQFSAAAGTYTGATLRMRRDDGAVVYLNGVEVVRSNLPTGEILFDTPASNADDDGNSWFEFDIDASLLVAGVNTLAVEIHQVSRTSSDISFDAELVIRRLNNGSTVSLNGETQVRARTLASDGTWSALESADFVLAEETADISNIRVSEIHYNPTAPDAEFIEIHNITSGAGAAEVDLSNVKITDGPSAPFVFVPETKLAAGEYGLVVQDITAFTAAYPNVDPSIILGEYTGKLSNSGETIRLEAADGSELFSTQYADNDLWGLAADGLGASLELVDSASTPADEHGKFYHWAESLNAGGTPGAARIAPPQVLINEVFANSASPLLDYIELANPTNADIDIGGWYLSDSETDRQKYQIPIGTVISAGGFVVFDEGDFNASPGQPGNFLLSSSGESVWLTATANGLPQFIDNVSFTGSFEDQSYGRLDVSTGESRLAPSAYPTPGEVNSVSRVSSVVISEVNYHPEDPIAAGLAIAADLTSSDLEFIEITNTTSATVDLGQWRIRGESDFNLPVQTLASQQSLVIVSFDPTDVANANRLAAFRAHYGIGTAVQIAGPFSGSLSNSFGRIALQRADLSTLVEDRSWTLADEVLYDDRGPWPAADGTGDSLNRITATSFGNAASSWTALSPTPGSVALVSAGVVEGRHVFYNDSSFDGNDPSAGASDDVAISGKSALLPGQTATFGHYTSYAKGINGLFVDIANLGLTALQASDFNFSTGNSSVASGYQPLGIDPAITVRPGAGANGSDRVSLIFPDGSVTKTWLQVTVKASAATGLSSDDVFYFGNVIGETGASSANALVNLADVTLTRVNQSGFGSVGIHSLYDFNRDGRVNLADIALARTNQSGFSSVSLITAPGAGSNSKSFSASSVFALTSVDSSSTSLSSVDAVGPLSFVLPAGEEVDDVGEAFIEEIAPIADVAATVVKTETAERDVVFSLPNFFELSDFETQEDEELAFDDVVQQRWAMYDHLWI